MFEKYSYKVKFRALLVVFCMLAATAYRRSFKNLWDLMAENKTLSEKEANVTGNIGDIDKLTAEIAVIDKVIGKNGPGKEGIQQEILGFVADHPSASLYNLEPIHSYTDEAYTVYTYSVDITGHINDLLAMGYDFEKSITHSRVVSMEFYTSKKEAKAGTLHLKLIFQNYENNK